MVLPVQESGDDESRVNDENVPIDESGGESGDESYDESGDESGGESGEESGDESVDESGGESYLIDLLRGIDHASDSNGAVCRRHHATALPSLEEQALARAWAYLGIGI